MTRIYSFARRLDFSRGTQEERDIALLEAWVDGCQCVTKTNLTQDKSGTDYVITLRGGTAINVDAKRRDVGCSRWWRRGPELALEKWSVRPTTIDSPRKTGWTLNEGNSAHCILFTFDPSDTSEAYLLPFQHLRMAYRRNLRAWHAQYKTDIQTTWENGRSWQSECVFVPASVVVAAINATSHAVATPDTEQDALVYQLFFPAFAA